MAIIIQQLSSLLLDSLFCFFQTFLFLGEGLEWWEGLEWRESLEELNQMEPYWMKKSFVVTFLACVCGSFVTGFAFLIPFMGTSIIKVQSFLH